MLGLGAESEGCSLRVMVDLYVSGIPSGVQLLAILADDLIRTALLAPPDNPSEPGPEDDDEFNRFFKISRFKFSRLLLPQLDAHVSDFALLLDALKGIPAPFPPPPIPGLFFDRMEGSTVGLARTGGLTGSCLALMTSWLLTYFALSASNLSTALRRFGFGSACLLKYSGPLLRMRRGTVELKGVAGPADLLPGRGGASVSVGMATRRLGWPAVVAIGAGWLTEGGVTVWRV